MSDYNQAIEDLMGRAYHRLISGGPQEGCLAEVLKLPGCVSAGETAAEALENLEESMAAWLESALAHDDPIPDAQPGPIRLSA